MRVLLVAQFYPPVIGGEERHVRALAQGLSQRGHRVTVATLAVEGAPGSEDDDGVRVERLPGTAQRLPSLYRSRRLAAPVPDPETFAALRRLVAETAPDIVHAHNWLVHSYLPLAAGSDRPLLLSLHDYGQVCAKKTLIYREALCRGPGLEKCLRCAADHYGTAKGIVTVAGLWPMAAAARRRVDAFLPVSTAVARGNRLEEDGLPYEVVPNFIPDDLPGPPRDPRLLEELPSDGFLLFVGAFARRKGVEVLLESYERMSEAPPLVLIGYRSSDVIPGLDRLPRNVRAFTDWPADAVAEAWRRSLVGIVPSTWADPCPTVAIEAMAAGRPVIASRIGGLVDLVDDGTTGTLVAPGDATALAAAVRATVADPGRAEAMGRAGRERSALFRASAVVRRIEEIYRRLLAEGEPRRHQRAS